MVGCSIAGHTQFDAKLLHLIECVCSARSVKQRHFASIWGLAWHDVAQRVLCSTCETTWRSACDVALVAQRGVVRVA